MIYTKISGKQNTKNRNILALDKFADFKNHNIIDTFDISLFIYISFQ